MRKQYFDRSVQSLPVPVPDHPKKVIPVSWKTHCNYPFIAIPIVSTRDPEEVSKTHFFCTTCCRWYSFSGTMGNLNHHIKNKHSELIAEEKHSLSEEARNKLFINFMLGQGIPFRMIDHPTIQQLFPRIGNRKDLSSTCSALAQRINSKIRESISNAYHLAVSTDEWTDQANLRYLGVQIHAITYASYDIRTIGLMQITELHASSKVIADMLKAKFEEYKIVGQVQGLVTDTAKVMKKVAEDMRIQWSPCYCHIVNLILGSFINSITMQFKCVQDLQNKLGRSTIFKQFCIRENAPISTIPGYTPTRWYSAYEMLNSICRLKQFIISYLQENKQEIPVESFWVNVEQMKFAFKAFKEVTKNLESNQFGTRSLVIPSFRYLEYKVKQLKKYPEWTTPLEAFDLAMNEYWLKNFNKQRTELLLATRLNPNFAFSLKKDETEEIDRYIFNLLKHARDINPRIITESAIDGNLNFYQWKKINSSENNEQDTDELGMYIDMVKVINNSNQKIDLWKFWNVDCGLVVLKNTAMKVYTIPASSAASERGFKRAKYLQSGRRINLSGEKLEDQLIIAENSSIL